MTRRRSSLLLRSKVNLILRFLVDSHALPFYENFRKRFLRRDGRLDGKEKLWRGGRYICDKEAIHRPKAIKTSNLEKVHERILLSFADHPVPSLSLSFSIYLSTIPYYSSSSRETKNVKKKRRKKMVDDDLLREFLPDPSISNILMPPRGTTTLLSRASRPVRFFSVPLNTAASRN